MQKIKIKKLKLFDILHKNKLKGFKDLNVRLDTIKTLRVKYRQNTLT